MIGMLFRRYIALAISLVCVCASSLAVAANLTPKDVVDGQLPSNDRNITFTTYNGNWVRDIKLPLTPEDNTVVTVISKAGYASNIAHATLQFEQLLLTTGDRVTVRYKASNASWSIDMENQSPNATGSQIDNSAGQQYVHYRVWNGNWTRQITLPEDAQKLRGIIISSDAAWDAEISSDQLLTKSSTRLKRGDTYKLTYNTTYKKWAFQHTPQRVINARDIRDGTVPTPTSPDTLVQFANANFIHTLSLPAQGKEGDTVTVRSRAAWTASILNANTNMKTPVSLRTGDEYVFVYRSDRRHWALFTHPEKSFNARDVKNGQLAVVSPTTKVYFSNGNWQRNLYLPQSPEGFRVHLKTDAWWSFTVQAQAMKNEAIHRGEHVTFVVNASGNWERETVTIDLLGYYSHRNVERLGEAASRNRLVEGMSLTNEALINSHANFRFRFVSIERFQSPSTWLRLGDALSALRSDKTAQDRRNALKADGIYYEGTESGCGLAWVRASRFNMVASGTIHCGTTVMRHELGHNMSLNHGVSLPEQASNYNVGYSREGTVMGGNRQPYFSTPELLSPTTKLPLGFEDQIDGVRAMNAFSHQVANYN
ncbi:zinc-dependent metalloprotease family protein [Enterovibrio baiacu]|uniref:zinc-dependent metalloprotease family protein n=1 Tax=Enterovibrio baiacu TaxID=2491023 RepID=UPI001386D490|nr:zinc-dependent metalloprotease family protein [Enterovibrio baiacu]